MLKKTAVFAVLIFFIMVNVAPSGSSALSARGYALVEQSTGRLIEGGDTDRRLPMASTTKIMTGLLACESGKFGMLVTVPGEAIRVEGSSMGLLDGEQLTLRDLTYGLLLQSGNDAANTIAYALAGSISGFAELMNKKAGELGLQNTHYTNPSGLDHIEHYTSALDLARLGAYAMKNEDFRKIVSTYKTRIPYNGIKDGRQLVNHNELLRLYNGTIGIKTGYTRRSGRCLVSCAVRNGVILVAATLNGHDDWNDHMTLLNIGFGKLKHYSLAADCPKITANIVGGPTDKINCSYRGHFDAVLTDKERPKIKTELFMRKFYYAPVEKGQVIGEIVFKLNETVLTKADIVAEESVVQEKPNKFKDFWLSIF